MIGCVEVKCVAAKPNFPLVPLFAFKGSPSSLRILDVPKSIGTWEINSVRVLMKYPDNTTIEKVATRTGSVWVATIEGCETTGKVGKGYEILADGIDENGDDVVGYVLGAGDIYILERDSDIAPDDQRFYVKYCQDIPNQPSKGDLLIVDANAKGITQLKIWDGEEWKAQTLYTKTSELINDAGFITESTLPSNLSDFNNDVGFITASAIPSNVGAFENDVGYLTSVSWGQVQNKPDVALMSDLPSKVSELDNDAGYITANSLPSKVSELENDVGFITASAIPSNVGAFTNDVGYLTASSQAFIDKRDKTDMSAVVGTTYASWNLSALHGTTYSPALELKWGTYTVWGQEQGVWLVDDEYRQVCFFLLPALDMLYWGYKNQDGSYAPDYGESITLSSDELSIATINGVAEITCTRQSKDGSPEVSTIATLKDLNDFKNINEKRDWWDNTYPASVDTSRRYTINTFSLVIGSNSYLLDQFSASGGTSTWKGSGSYPTITTMDGINFTLTSDASTSINFSISQLKPGPATGIIGGNNYTAIANFKTTTFALKDYVDAQIGSINTALDTINGEVI